MFTHALLILGGGGVYCCKFIGNACWYVLQGLLVQEKTGSSVNMNVARCVLMDYTDHQNRLGAHIKGGEKRADLDSVPEKRKFPSLLPLLCKASVHVTSDTGQDHLRQIPCASATCITALELGVEYWLQTKTSHLSSLSGDLSLENSGVICVK